MTLRADTNKQLIYICRKGSPWHSRGSESVLSLPRAWLQLLLRELRSCKPHSSVPPHNTLTKKIQKFKINKSVENKSEETRQLLVPGTKKKKKKHTRREDVS